MSENRTYDGKNNNLLHPQWGSAGTVLRRVAAPDYTDSGFASRTTNPREISNRVAPQKDKESPTGLSDFTWAWGQFLDHEIDISPESEKEHQDIEVPDSEAVPNGVQRPAVIPFKRSTSVWVDGVREQTNALSAYIDAANVYGSNCTRASALRSHDGSGKLRSQHTPRGELLPRNPGGLANVPNKKKKFFLAGDIRANEHAVLASMHTVFMREHNRLCDQIYNTFPDEYHDDESIYQAARKVVGAQMQVITYQEYLPILLGPDAIGEYKGYNPHLDATIANEFSTAFYRLGHSMLSDNVRLNSGGLEALRNLFFNPQPIRNAGIEEFLGGLFRQTMQNIDVHVIDGVRNFLFNPMGSVHARAPGQPVSRHAFLDLVALNIQRGRDHGLPGYNACRIAYGLSPHSSFSDISCDPEVAHSLAAVYSSPDEVDPWIGALAENTLPGAAVGELTCAALVEQFTRLRDGDRFWWENDDALVLREWRADIASGTLGDILNRNTTGLNFPRDVFHALRY